MKVYTLKPFYSTDEPIPHYDAPAGVELEKGEFWLPASVMVIGISQENERGEMEKSKLPMPRRFVRDEVKALFSKPGNEFVIQGKPTRFTAEVREKPWADPMNPDGKPRMFKFLKLTPVGEQPVQDRPSVDFEPDKAPKELGVEREPKTFTSFADMKRFADADLNSAAIPTFDKFCEGWDQKMNSIEI